MKEFLECGKIVTTHGVRGEVKVDPWCDGPELFTALETVYLGKDLAPVVVEQARIHKTMSLLKLVGTDTIAQAAALRGKVVYARREDIPLEPGEYFIQDLVGLEVVDADTGALYGKLTQVSPTGANDVYHILFADGKERLIPAIKQVVIATDLEAGRMEIRPLEGLFDDAED